MASLPAEPSAMLKGRPGSRSTAAEWLRAQPPVRPSEPRFPLAGSSTRPPASSPAAGRSVPLEPYLCSAPRDGIPCR